MLTVDELKAYGVTYDPELNKRNNVGLCQKKLDRANAMLDKWGIPKEWEDRILAEERQNAVWIKGTLSQATIDTYHVIVEATDAQPQMKYVVIALTDALNKLIKDYLGNVVSVHIKPKDEATTPLEYELIEVG